MPPSNQPNIIIMLTDDQGYQDVGCYGARGFDTPHLDRMAAGGMRFTDFYVGAPTCTPSRASLLTGCYPQRVGLPTVLAPWDTIGLSTEEPTLASLLKQSGYATACFGKWHLGCQPQFMPNKHGFDEYFGLPYSNDQWPFHPRPERAKLMPPLPLMDNDTVLEHNPDQTQLTTWYTEHSVDFIERHQEQPFFLYVPHSMPHVPLHVSDKFKGKSDRGLYGDVMMEIDWSMGEILSTLDRLDMVENTLVVFLSDNGPWLEYGDHAGCALPLREGKWTTFDGGQRVPCIMQWQGNIPAGQVCGEIATAMDILPTFCKLAGIELPERPVDGKDILPLLCGKPNAESPHEAFYYYAGDALEAVRCGQWKLHLPHSYRHHPTCPTGGQPGEVVEKHIELSLFDIERDIGETENLAADQPELVERMRGMAEQFDAYVQETRRRDI